MGKSLTRGARLPGSTSCLLHSLSELRELQLLISGRLSDGGDDSIVSQGCCDEVVYVKCLEGCL